MNIIKILFICTLVFSIPSVVFAQETVSAEQQDFEKRLSLAREMQSYHSVKEQVDAAIDQASMTQPQNKREAFRTAMRSVLNYKAIENMAINAMAETYTIEELQVMLDYHSKPEARSIAEKEDQYSAKIYPEIVRMLDKAMMQARTGGK